MGIMAAYAVPHPPLIIPSVGRGEEKTIQATIDSYEEMARRIAAIAPDTIVVSSPHAPAYRDAFAVCPAARIEGNMLRYGSPEHVRARVDVELTGHVEAAARILGLPVLSRAWRGAAMDHATLIPLHFINRLYGSYRLFIVGLSGLSDQKHRLLGQLIAGQAEALGRRCVFIASGDLSHRLDPAGSYGFAKEGPVFDEGICRAFDENDLDALFCFDERVCEKAGECGLRSFQIMAGALDGYEHDGRLLSYEGPFGVGYAVAAFEGPEAAGCAGAFPEHVGARGHNASTSDAEAPVCESGGQPQPASEPEPEQDPYVKLARASLEAWTRSGKRIEVPEDLPEEMVGRKAAVFVSLHEHGRLRGCIGTLQPCTESVACEIVRNAILACSEDPRFEPVRADELDDIECSVDVLGEPEKIAGLDMLDARRYGVIVTQGSKKGVLLPDLEGVDTPEQQVSIAKQKAGIGFGQLCGLERFEVVRHHER